MPSSKAQPWSGSDRSSRLPRGWPKIRRRVFRRDDWTCRHPDCDYTDRRGEGLECDHIESGDNHQLDNLQTLCKKHHQSKTIAERPPPPPRPSRSRPPPSHPGLTVDPDN